MTENAKPEMTEEAEIESGPATVNAAKAPEITDLLEKISKRIAEAEADEEQTLDGVRERLEVLRDQTSEAHDHATTEERGTFASVEAALEKLSRQVNEREQVEQSWDDEAAEALTSHCEDAGLAEGDKPVDLLLGDDTPADASSEAPGYVYLQPSAQEIGQKWFEDRFEELAKRFDEASGHVEGGGFSSVMEKLDTLEVRLATLLGEPGEDGVNGGALQDIELCIAEIANQLEANTVELKRIEKIEAQVSDLAERMAGTGDGNGAGMAGGALDADLIANMIADRMTAQPLVSNGNGGAQAGPAGGITELSETLKTFMNERRSEEDHANAVLDTMQQTIIRLLDRMEALERKNPRSGPAPSETPPAPNAGTPRAAEHKGPSDQPGANKTASRPMAAGAPAESTEKKHGRTPTLGGQPRPEAAAAAMQPDARPEATQSAESVSLDRLKRVVGQLDTDDSAPTDNANQAPRNRADFIAAARRAAANAGSGDGQTGADPVQAERAKFSAAAREAVLAGAQGINDDMPEAEEIDATNDGFSLGSIGARFRSKGKSKAKNGDRTRALVAIVAMIAIGLGSAKLMMSLSSDAARQQMQTDTIRQQGAPVAENGITETSPKQARLSMQAPQEGAMPVSSVQPGSVAYNSDGETLNGLVQPAAVNPSDAQTDGGQPVSGGPGTVTQKELPSMLVGPLSLRLAAANGDASAEFQVAARFAEGSGVEQDFNEAVKWYNRSAARGFALSQYRLGTLYERGLGVTKDINRARVWYQRAAANDNIKSMHNLAVLAASPQAGKADYETAAAWFTKAAQRGLADSQFNLAILYQNGLGLPLDNAAAYKWFSLAAKGGDAEAVKRMKEVAGKLSKKEVAQIDAETDRWMRQPSKRLANDPHYAGQAWQRSNS